MSQPKDVIEDFLARRRNRNAGGGRGPGVGGGSDGFGGWSGRTIALAAVAVLVLAGIVSCFYTVQPEERAVVKRFGKVYGIAEPGLHFKLPFGVDAVQHVATERVLKQEFGFRTEEDREPARSQFSGSDFPDESLMLTGDLNIIDVEWVVQYRISDPIKYLYGMREPTRTLRDLSESVMRRVVGNHIGSDVLTVGRVEIGNKVRDELQSAMDKYDNGIQVMTVQLQDVVPPARVQPAFNDVNEARQELERMVNEATRQANEAIPRAEGAAKRTIAEAEGYAIERVNRAQGETARFTDVLGEYRNAPGVTRSRMYLETLGQALPKIGSVVVVQEGQTAPLPLLNLRDAQPLRAPAPAAAPPQAAPQASAEPSPPVDARQRGRSR
jgi:membrane protease subunit HflK